VGPETQASLLKARGRFPLSTLDEEHRLLKLRVLQLSFVRQGRPAPELVKLAIEKLNPRYPATTWAENRELVRLLVYLDAPGVVGRTLDLIDRAPTQEQQMHYIAQLRNLRTGWSPEERQRYFAWWLQPRDHLQRPASLLHWFQDAGRECVDGASLNQHLAEFRGEAAQALTSDQRAALKPLLDQPIAGAQLIPAQPRPFVRQWSMADLLPELDRASNDRDFERGRRAFIDTQCYACHRLGNAGGAVGPEIAAVASKYTRRDLLESLLEPSKVISEQFQNVSVILVDSETLTGRLISESDTDLVIETDPLTNTRQTIARARMQGIRPSPVSPMPEGLLNILSKEEVLDLLAFLESGGKADAPAFRERTATAKP
jgi:putative heme-binding domain-containing protein